MLDKGTNAYNYGETRFDFKIILNTIKEERLVIGNTMLIMFLACFSNVLIHLAVEALSVHNVVFVVSFEIINVPH